MFNSEQLAKVSIAAERTFEIIWCFGDDRGRIKDDAAEIWANGWMKRRKECTIDDVEDHIDALVENGQLCRYAVGGDSFLHSISWDEHQSISHPTPSKLPPCREHQPLEWKFWWKNNDTATDRWRQKEKADQKAKSSPEELGDDSGVSPEKGPIELGGTPPQCSSVQLSSDKADLARASDQPGQVRQFVRPSQRRQA
ncbi:hypothetical protein P3H15_32700 [Rhodococcus sp. T2V]|uniref:hypothetical protein n=1 Tax=Rhodococcus sp. T2V TaxID=3034164 RepID=UPI0023E2555F|nr:hypothetical protein [Rhodococcus sp. T2V]MDF3309780.1 hypothetical protein [Rhodococcus sp. T2V]